MWSFRCAPGMGDIHVDAMLVLSCTTTTNESSDTSEKGIHSQVDSSVVTDLKFVNSERRDEVQCPSLNSEVLNSPMEGISCDKIMKVRQAGLNTNQDI